MQIVGLRVGRMAAIGVAVVVALALGAVAPTAQAGGPAFRAALLEVTDWPVIGGQAVPGPTVSDGVGPGSYLLIERPDGDFICTANFVWNGTPGGKYLGAAGHCFLPAPLVGAAPVEVALAHQLQNVKVRVCVSDCAFGGQLGSVVNGRFEDLGPVVYARQSRNGDDVGNDFGLVKIPIGTTIRTSLPVWGGPTGSSAPKLGDRLCTYGNAAVFGEVFATKARTGIAGNAAAGSWYATLPSAPGDSGAAVVSCPLLRGTAAVGILTHLATNGSGVIAGTTVARAIEMTKDDAGLDISLG